MVGGSRLAPDNHSADVIVGSHSNAVSLKISSWKYSICNSKDDDVGFFTAISVSRAKEGQNGVRHPSICIDGNAPSPKANKNACSIELARSAAAVPSKWAEGLTVLLTKKERQDGNLTLTLGTRKLIGSMEVLVSLNPRMNSTRATSQKRLGSKLSDW